MRWWSGPVMAACLHACTAGTVALLTVGTGHRRTNQDGTRWMLLVPATVFAVADIHFLAQQFRQVFGAHRISRELDVYSDLMLSPCLPLAAPQPVRVVRDSKAVALTHGLLRPRIVVSTGLLRRCSETELRAILEHEAEHVRRRDPLRTLVARVGVGRWSRVSAVAHFLFCLKRDAELRADRAAIRVVGPQAVASAIASISHERTSRPIHLMAGGDSRILTARVDQLSGARPGGVELDSGGTAVTAAVLTAMLALVVITISWVKRFNPEALDYLMSLQGARESPVILQQGPHPSA